MATPYHKRKPQHRSPSQGGPRGPRRQKMSAEPTSRDAAIRLLTVWQDTGEFPNRQWEGHAADALTRELVWGCIRNQSRLNAWINHLSNQTPADRLFPPLWIGLYQILELDGIADHAAVHETVEAARRQRCPKSMLGYLNAVLRRATREKRELKEWMNQWPLHVRGCHPLSLITRWEEQFGEEETLRIVNWNNERGQTILRRTALEPDRAEWTPGAEGFPPKLQAHPAGPDWFIVDRGMPPTALPGFEEGAWYAQDPSTRIAAEMLEVKPGETVLDACAAPGGKTGILADAMKGEGTLIAADRDPARCKRIQENMDRLQLNQRVDVMTVDVKTPPDDWLNHFDAVLLDVPCSNTGVLQRRPDARWRFSLEELEEITDLQHTILHRAAIFTKPGGRLVYSTCSIEREEGPEQIQRFLEENEEWTLETERLLRPGEEQSDGAYAARLRRAPAE